MGYSDMNYEDADMFCPEIHMKHYDKGSYDTRVVQQQNLAAKEASYIQALGYVPTLSLSNQDWEDQLQRNKLARTR